MANAERQHDLGQAPEQRQEPHPEQDQVGPLGEGITRSDPDIQQLAVEYAYQQRPLPAAVAGRCNPSGVADGTRRVLLKTTTSTSLLLVLDAWRDQSTRPEYQVTPTPF